MAIFLKTVSGIYLFCVWLAFALMMAVPTPLAYTAGATNSKVIAFMIAIGLSIPAAVLFGFAQIVGDIRIMRDSSELQREHLEAMRRYYEPQR